MKFLKSKWKLILLGYFLLSYIVMVVVMKQPLSDYFLNVGLALLLVAVLNLGTFTGFVGFIVHLITKSEDAAFPLYRLAYQFNTSNPTIMASYGLILLRKNNPKTALACFERGYNVSRNYITTKTLMSNIAIAKWKLDDLDGAIEQYYTIIERFGDDEQVFLTEPDYSDDNIEQFCDDNHMFYVQDYITLGFLLSLKKDFEKALFFTNAALYKSPDNASAYDNLGQIAYFRGDMTLAKEHFEKALNKKANLPDSLYFMGLIAYEEGDNAKALDYYNQAKDCSLDGLNTISYKLIDKAIAEAKK